MSIYICNHCGNYVDDDYHPGEVDPDDDCKLICPRCSEEYGKEYAKQAMLDHDHDYQSWVTQRQNDNLKYQMENDNAS